MNQFKVYLGIAFMMSTVASLSSFAVGEDGKADPHPAMYLNGDKMKPFPLERLPKDALALVLSHLPRVEMEQARKVCRQFNQSVPSARTVRDNRIRNHPLVKQFLGELIEVPAVTQEEVDQLQAALTARDPEERTHIVPMPKFRVAKAMNSIGLYYAVMGRYPDLEKADWPYDTQVRAALRQRGEQNPDLPLTNTTLAEDEAFAQELSRLTGRNLRVMSESQDEYTRRGRVNGQITSSRFHFGDDPAEVIEHAFTSNNLLTQDRSHGVHEIPEGKNYTNSLGLVQAIGNVWSRSSGGVIRGGSFRNDEWEAKSSDCLGGYADSRHDGIGSRLVEDLPQSSVVESPQDQSL